MSVPKGMGATGKIWDMEEWEIFEERVIAFNFGVHFDEYHFPTIEVRPVAASVTIVSWDNKGFTCRVKKLGKEAHVTWEAG